MLDMYDTIFSLAPLVQAACSTKSKYDKQSKVREPLSAFIVRRNGISLSVTLFAVVTFYVRGLKQGKLAFYHISPGDFLCFIFLTDVCSVSFSCIFKHRRDCCLYHPVTMATAHGAVVFLEWKSPMDVSSLVH